MSQKTLFTKSALAVAVAIISTQAWSAGFQLNEFSSSCNIPAGPTYTLATGLISKMYLRPYTSRSCYSTLHSLYNNKSLRLWS